MLKLPPPIENRKCLLYSATSRFRQRRCRPCLKTARSDQSQVKTWPAPSSSAGYCFPGSLMYATLFTSVSTKHLHARISLNKNHVVKAFHTQLFSQLQ